MAILLLFSRDWVPVCDQMDLFTLRPDACYRKALDVFKKLSLLLAPFALLSPVKQETDVSIFPGKWSRAGVDKGAGKLQYSVSRWLENKTSIHPRGLAAECSTNFGRALHELCQPARKNASDPLFYF